MEGSRREDCVDMVNSEGEVAGELGLMKMTVISSEA